MGCSLPQIMRFWDVSLPRKRRIWGPRTPNQNLGKIPLKDEVLGSPTPKSASFGFPCPRLGFGVLLKSGGTPLSLRGFWGFLPPPPPTGHEVLGFCTPVHEVWGCHNPCTTFWGALTPELGRGIWGSLVPDSEVLETSFFMCVIFLNVPCTPLFWGGLPQVFGGA